MKYLVKCFALMKVHSNGQKSYVKRWVRLKKLDQVFKAKNKALKYIATELHNDKAVNLLGLFKYTLQCIKGGKHGKR